MMAINVRLGESGDPFAPLRAVACGKAGFLSLCSGRDSFAPLRASFDRALRTVKKYYETVEYIHLNPVRRGLGRGRRSGNGRACMSTPG